MKNILRLYRKPLICSLSAAVYISSISALQAQNSAGQQGTRVVTTAVPILTVSPDARSAALGDAGVAISPDANTPHWNPGKLGFMPKDFGASASYTPWLRNLINDMSLSYLSAYKRLGENRALSVSLLYFNLGAIKFTDDRGNELQEFNPKEYTINVAYGQKLSENLSLGVGAKFIRSNLSGNAPITSGITARPGNSAGADIGLYYTKDLTVNAHESKLAFGANISNIGPRITYSNASADSANFNYLPTNLRLGTAYTYELDPFNKVTFTVDANKLLVPTPTENGKAPNKALLDAMFSSLSDAPGGFKEEMQEINYSSGIEYWYNDLFAARAGYFYEHPNKGARKYFSMGLGLRYQVLGIDIAYLIPGKSNSPLAQTLRFTISINLDKQTEEQAAPVIE